jgi:NAD+ synthase
MQMVSWLAFEPAAEADRIVECIRRLVCLELRRRGAVVGVSGGIDSAVVASLCARALGEERVMALLMPEADSSADSLRLGRQVAQTLGIQHEVEDITPVLRAARCYERRDQAIRRVVPDLGPGDRYKIVLPDVVSADSYSLFSAVVCSPEGLERRARLDAEAYLGVVAATNFKQRVRAMLEYYHADRLQYAVAGTPNLLEYELGFFVKGGDGAADLKPIAHLYKSQVYQLGEYLRVPREILERRPTTDTYALEQTQEEFYFSLPLAKMDICVYGYLNDVKPTDLMAATELDARQIQRVYSLIEARRRQARYLHAPPLTIATRR